jgi:hypothetical protein
MTEVLTRLCKFERYCLRVVIDLSWSRMRGSHWCTSRSTGCSSTADEGEIYSKYNHGTLPLSSPHLVFSFPQPLSPFAVCRSWSAVLPSASTLSLRFVATLHSTRAIPALLLPLPPPFPSPPLDGSKTHRRGLQANSKGEWLGIGGL